MISDASKMRTKNNKWKRRHLINKRIAGNGTSKVHSRGPWTYARRYKAVRMRRVQHIQALARDLFRHPRGDD